MMQQQLPLFEDQPNLLFMPSLFHEAMDIIFDSYEYFQIQETLDDDSMPPYLRGVISNEMSRITMRLTSVMAWLMARKAVSTGQLSNEEASEEYRIDGVEHCLEQNQHLHTLLPEYMNELLDKSHQLYERVWRLDCQIYETHQERNDSPAHIHQLH